MGVRPRLDVCGGDGAAATRTCQVSSQDQQRSNFRSPCRSGGPGPSPGSRGVRIPGRGLGTRAALASSHAPRPAPGRGRTAPPPAPAHRLTPALTHTHTPSRALAHALPSLLLCLSPPAVWGPRRSPALRLRHAVSAPARRLTVRGYATAMALRSFLNSERGPSSSLPARPPSPSRARSTSAAGGAH